MKSRGTVIINTDGGFESSDIWDTPTECKCTVSIDKVHNPKHWLVHKVFSNTVERNTELTEVLNPESACVNCYQPPITFFMG